MRDAGAGRAAATAGYIVNVVKRLARELRSGRGPVHSTARNEQREDNGEAVSDRCHVLSLLAELHSIRKPASPRNLRPGTGASIGPAPGRVVPRRPKMMRSRSEGGPTK